MINRPPALKKPRSRSGTLHSGFSLIELLTVIAVIATLLAGILIVINPVEQIKKSNDSRRKSDLAQIKRGLEVYYQDHNSYPESINGNIAFEGEAIAWGSDWKPYMNVIPSDPNSSKNYFYWVDSSGQSYRIYASLDRGNDPQACNGGNACTGANPDVIDCGGICNYGVSSPNISP